MHCTRIFFFTWMLGLFVTLTGCSEDATSGQCQVSLDCETYTTCAGGSCKPLSCATSADCPSTDVCVQNLEGEFVCSAIECTSTSDCADDAFCLSNICIPTASASCAEDGATCLFANDCCSQQCDGESKTCVPFSGCKADADCEDGQTCNLDTGECSAPEATGCTPESCGDGICNAETGECEAVVASDDYPCMPCETDADCGDIGGCVSLGGLKSCLPSCNTKNDCATGFECFNLQPGGYRCVPGTFTCAIDCIAGCADGQVCDLDLNQCVTQLNLCDSCEKDYLCGAGNRCVKTGDGAEKKCVPSCLDGNCANGGLCETVEQLDVCLPAGSECCFGPTCSGACGSAGSCGGTTPYCLGGNQCVECLNSTTCGAGCTCENNACSCPEDSCGECKAPTAVCNPQTQECVQCLTNDDCNTDAGQFCNVTTKTCEVDICSACVSPYPACAEINGQFSCVQCTEDADCASGACNEKTYFCEGSTGISDNCKCTTDADCPTNTQFTLKCDTSLGLCYDIAGNCDGISACCDVGSGSECISVFELLGAGMSLPAGLPGGATGLCSCAALGDLCAVLPDLCGGSAGKCPGGITCTPNLFGLLFGAASGGGDVPSDFCGEL